MKRFLSLVLSCCLLFSACCAKADFWTDIKDAASDAGTALDGVVNDAGEFWDNLAGTLRDAAENLSNSLSALWNQCGSQITDLWNQGTDAFASAWDWTTQQGQALWLAAVSAVGDAGDWITLTGDSAMEKLQEVWNQVFALFGIAQDKAEEAWNGLQQFAQEHGITGEKAAKVGILVVVVILYVLVKGGHIAVETLDITEQVLRPLISVFTGNGLTTDEAIDSLLNQVLQFSK